MMTARKSAAGRVHDEVWALLPWFVNGTLDEFEATRVRNHMRTCTRCQREVAGQTWLRGRIHRAPPMANAVAPGFEKLLARIQNETVAAPSGTGERAAPGLFERLQQWVSPLSRRPLAWSLATALLAVSALPLWLYPGWLVGSSPFHTAANPGSFAQFQPNDIRVVFAEPLSPAAIDAIVAPMHGRVVAGPSGPGVYTIRFDDGDRLPAALASRLGMLRARKDVAVAEPAVPLSEPRQ